MLAQFEIFQLIPFEKFAQNIPNKNQYMLDVLVEHNLVLQSQLVLLSLFFYTLTEE